MITGKRSSTLVWSWTGPLLAAIAVASVRANPVSFMSDVAPIFQRHCVGCHKEGKAKGKYRMDTYAESMKALVAGNLEDSELYYRIITDDEDDRMPAEADPLAKSEVEVIRRWIEAGAGNDSGDPDAVLSTILPMKEHPAAPASYPRPLPVTALVFADQGRELVSGGYHELLVWDARSGELRRRIGNNGQRTYDLALSPDGKLLAAATGAPGQAGEVRVFETASGAVVATPFRGDDVMLAVAFDHRGERLAFGGTSGDLNVVSTANWEKQVTVTAHSDWLNALAWNAEGNRIATASRDRTGKVFEIGAEGKRLVTFSGHSDPVRGVAFHPNGNEVISCDDSGLVVRWKIGDGKKSGDLASLDGPSLRLTRGEAGYFVGSGGGKAVQFRLEDQNRVRDLQSGGDSAALVTALAMHGELLALGEADGRVTLLDWASSEPRNTFVVMPK